MKPKIDFAFKEIMADPITRSNWFFICYPKARPQSNQRNSSIKYQSSKTA